MCGIVPVGIGPIGMSGNSEGDGYPFEVDADEVVGGESVEEIDVEEAEEEAVVSVEEEEEAEEAEVGWEEEVMKPFLDASNMDLRCDGTLMRRWMWSCSISWWASMSGIMMRFK